MRPPSTLPRLTGGNANGNSFPAQHNQDARAGKRKAALGLSIRFPVAVALRLVVSSPAQVGFPPKNGDRKSGKSENGSVLAVDPP